MLLSAAFIFAIALMVFGSLTVYFAPTITACIIKHTDWPAIFIINLFFGWSLLGWVVAAVWAVKSDN